MLIADWNPEETKRKKEKHRREALRTAKRRAQEAEAHIKAIRPVLKKLKERNDTLELLLPFEKLQALEKEIQILEARRSIIYGDYAVKEDKEGAAAAQVIGVKFKKISNKIDEKKREYYNIKLEANKLTIEYNFPYSLISDPRVKPYEEFTGDFRINKRVYKKPAFKYFPIDEEELKKSLNKTGNRYSEKEIRKRDNAIQDLRSKLLEEKDFLNV